MRKAVSTKGFIVNFAVNVPRQELANGVRHINDPQLQILNFGIGF